MPLDESAYLKDWLRIAEKDLSRAERLLVAEDPEAAGFYLQQAVEKFLKAFLLSKGWRLKKIHDLEVLLNDALAHAPSLEEFRALCQKASGFYFLERYPISVEATISDEDVQDSLREAHQLVERLRSQLP